MGGTFLAVQRCFDGAFLTVGVDHGGNVPSGLGQLGRGQRPGLLQQHPLGLRAQRRAGRQGLHRVGDDTGLRHRRVPVADRGQGVGVVRGHQPGLPDPATSVPAEPAAQVGEPVRGRGPAQPPPRHLPEIDLREHRHLEGVHRTASPLELAHALDQLVIGPRRRQPVAGLEQQTPDSREHRSRCGVGSRCDRHTHHAPDTHRQLHDTPRNPVENPSPRATCGHELDASRSGPV